MEAESSEDQICIPATLMRGGSSKAVFLHATDIPPPGGKRDRLLKRIMGTPDPLQIDGMGGTKAVTSKMAIISASDRPDTDVDYTFVQVAVADNEIQYNLNCGNISAAVGPWAIDEGLIKGFRNGRKPPTDPEIVSDYSNGVDSSVLLTRGPRYQEIRIYNTGTGKNMIAHVPIGPKGRSVSKGDFKIAAVPGSGAPIMLDYRETIGAALNRGLLPTGNVTDELRMSNGQTVKITMCDVGNLCVFAAARDLGVSGYESAAELTGNKALIQAAKELRGRAAALAGMCRNWDKVDEQSPFVPMPVLVAPPPSVHPEAHVSGRLFLDNMCHESMAGTGSVCFAACSRIRGSVVFDIVGEKAGWRGTFNIAHPVGVMPVAVEVEESSTDRGNPKFLTLSFIRTARRLMDGRIYVPTETLDDAAETNGHAPPNGTLTVSSDNHALSNSDLATINGASTHTKTVTSSPAAQNTPVTQLFADFASRAGMGEVELNPFLKSRLREYLIDYIAVTAAAAHDCVSTPAILNAVMALGGHVYGSNTVVGKGRKFTPQYAGLLNATFGHSMDFDDTYAEGTLHAGVTAISAGLAQAELLGPQTTATQFLTAVAVGYEVTCRLGRELGNEAYARGMHNTSTAGIFGAVATIAVLKRLDSSTIENAFGLAVSKAAGSMQYLENGSWNKRLHPGFAVHDAFVAIALAESGVLGAAKAFEGTFGFLHAYSPKEYKDLDRLTRNLGAEWVFTETSLKPFPACRMTHGCIEMASAAAESDSNRSKQIEKMTVWLSSNNLSVVGQRTQSKLRPQNVVDAQFSVFFQTAHAFLYGMNVGPAMYSRIDDTEVQNLAQKIECVVDEKYKGRHGMGSRLRIDFTDGTSDEREMLSPLGENEHPFTREQIDAKALGMLTPVFGEVQAARIRDVVDGIEEGTVVELSELLELLCYSLEIER
ncbi:hypothetical protein PV08_00505 [Exophiala spinifera]|uniref:MmgE/PrpD family protein n=1 Tax=Exophiala spinifera TaxID=91928 RepID=A0A0D2BN04_9EURO|nr:uncharacterized protein PV08_00505 [Exophiala spinifera]KIW19930.1 hypothetical protein PV08_00505 [Exophiala spinifera]